MTATTTTAAATRLCEWTAAGEAIRVDRGQSLIAGVKVLGATSLNGRRYTAEALRQAVGLYENVAVNVDHIDGRRSYRDRIGRLRNARLGPDGVYADLEVNPKHPLAEQLFWDAEHCPRNVGLSHDAEGRTRIDQGLVIVEALTKVRGVDLVAEPATTHGLFEDAAAVAAAAPNAADAATPDADGDCGDGDAADAGGRASDDVDKLADDEFALVLPGGVRIGRRTFPLHKRRFPLHTAEAVRRSLAAIRANRQLSAAHRAAALASAEEAARRYGISITQEDRSMKIEDVTIEQLKEARPDLVAQLQAAGEAQAELLRLKEERDRLAAQLDAATRRQKVAEGLAAAGLTEERVPESLRGALYAADDAQRPKLIADLKALLAPRTQVESARAAAALPAQFEDRIKLWN